MGNICLYRIHARPCRSLPPQCFMIKKYKNFRNKLLPNLFLFSPKLGVREDFGIQPKCLFIALRKCKGAKLRLLFVDGIFVALLFPKYVCLRANLVRE